MTELQLAALWWRKLYAELGNSACDATRGPLGKLSSTRTDALRRLFFTLLTELPVDRLIEVGAHDAQVSKRFVQLKPEAKAFAYEGNAALCERALARGLPRSVTLTNCAVGAISGSVTFFVPRDERLLIWGSTRRRAGYDNVEEVVVPMTTLEQIGQSIPMSGVGRHIGLWIDVEGSALDVLIGGETLLRERVATAYLEVNDASVYDGAATSLEILALLLKHRFIPIARDNQYSDAWNLLIAHEECYCAAQETIAKWHYKNAGIAAAVDWLVANATSPDN
jgi:FkbM family methyltransferase